MRKRETIGGDGQTDLFGPAPLLSKRRQATPAPATTMPSRKPQAQGLLNVREAAVRLGLSKSTLDKLRCKGKGPRFIKSTERAVRYDPVDLDAWIANRRRQSTAD